MVDKRDERPGRSQRHYESVVDQQIRQAEERGEFADLPGLGKPLKDLDRANDDLWWVKDYLMREELPTEALLPTPLLLRREKERLPELVRELPSEQAVRDLVAAFNKRVLAELRAPSGPFRPVGPANAEALVAEWRAAHETRLASAPAAEAPDGDVSAAEESGPWWRRWRRKAS
jgi:hypothetical protein